MALSKIQSESVNLADNFAFTGTVSGAGSEGLVHLETQTGTDVASVKFGNNLVNINNYKKYYVIGRVLPVTDGGKQRLRFMDAAGNDIATTNAYRGSVNSGTTSYLDYINISGNMGSSNSVESGGLFFTNIDIQHIGTADFQAQASSYLSFNNTGNNYSYQLSNFGYNYGYDSTQPAGFNFYPSAGNYARVRISLFGVTEGS
ncbi:hypothetical protein OAP51_05820 [Alphaproteobacteria bacterium]|nr:hypothetical protein [Alphaproteobacteria bacterium]